MAFTKVTVPAVDPGNISPLADRPALSAAQLKAKFDKGGEDVEAALEALAGEINALIDEIEANTSAENVGAAPVFTGDASASNVQAKLARLKQYVDDTVVIIGAADMRKAVYDTNDDGTVDSADEAAKLATARKINGVDFDGTQDITVTAVPTAHTHTKSAITDFPASMPASDVSAWAKAATKPTYTASEVGAAKSIVIKGMPTPNSWRRVCKMAAVTGTSITVRISTAYSGSRDLGATLGIVTVYQNYAQIIAESISNNYTGAFTQARVVLDSADNCKYVELYCGSGALSEAEIEIIGLMARDGITAEQLTPTTVTSTAITTATLKNGQSGLALTSGNFSLSGTTLTITI